MTQRAIPSQHVFRRQRGPVWWKIWLEWVAANSVGELLGLGLIGVLAAVAFPWLDTLSGRFSILAGALLMILAGALLEGCTVGVAQWRVLRGVLPDLRWQTWVLATGAGAAIAWTLGMIPSTMIALTQETTVITPPPELSDTITYVLAAGMGLILGIVLAIPQWLALNQHSHGAGWWVPANAVAWIVGMILIFMGMGTIPADGLTPRAIVVVLGSIAAAGGVVGAIHGFVLVAILRTPRPMR